MCFLTDNKDERQRAAESHSGDKSIYLVDSMLGKQNKRRQWPPDSMWIRSRFDNTLLANATAASSDKPLTESALKTID
jgi:hypothetical protein